MASSAPCQPIRRFSIVEQAAALGIVLTKEFGTPFRLYDATTGASIAMPDLEVPLQPKTVLEPEVVIRFGRSEQAEARLQADGRFQLILVAHERGNPVLVATGEVAALTKTVSDLAQEQMRLQRWAQAVCDRLRFADSLSTRHREEAQAEPQTKTAWETLLRIDHVVRRLRIHKDPTKNQRRVVRAAWEVMSVQALAWVPKNADEPVVIQDGDAVSEWEARQLASRIAQAPELQSTGVLIWNQVQESSWAGRFPFLHNLLAMPVNDKAASGWLIAINKQAARGTPLSAVLPFRRSDAALMTPFTALLDLHVRGSGRYRDLQDLLVGLAQSLTAAIDAKDSYTYGHSERVARIAVVLGRQMDLQDEEVSDLFLAGLLHDIGKIGIRDAVLSKEGRLTREEFEHVKQHVIIGYSILQNLRPISHLLPGVRNHHERFDGTGYPDQMAGDAIPMMARILAVADAYDAMTTSRPYRGALSVQQVEQILESGAGSQWDLRVVDAFLACRLKVHGIRQRGVGDSLRHVLHDVLRSKSSTLMRGLVTAPKNGD